MFTFLWALVKANYEMLFWIIKQCKMMLKKSSELRLCVRSRQTRPRTHNQPEASSDHGEFDAWTLANARWQAHLTLYPDPCTTLITKKRSEEAVSAGTPAGALDLGILGGNSREWPDLPRAHQRGIRNNLLYWCTWLHEYAADRIKRIKRYSSNKPLNNTW